MSEFGAYGIVAERNRDPVGSAASTADAWDVGSDASDEILVGSVVSSRALCFVRGASRHDLRVLGPRNATIAIGIASAASLVTAPSLASHYFLPSLFGVAGICWSEQLVDGEKNQNRRLEILRELDSFSFLEENWDGEGGVTPSKGAVSAAKEFVLVLDDDKLPTSSCAVGDGEILIQWDWDFNFIEAAFNGETISWYARVGGSVEYGDDRYLGALQVDGRLMDSIRAFRRV